MADRPRHAGQVPVAGEEESQRDRGPRPREGPPGERPRQEGEEDLPEGEEQPRLVVALWEPEGQCRTQAVRRTRTDEAR